MNTVTFDLSEQLQM